MAFRNGQWVKLKKAMVFGENKEPVGAVGIYTGPATERTPEGFSAPIIGHGEVHLVDFPQGTTRLKIGVADDMLEPVLSRTEIPANRLATMREDWEPVA